MGDIRIYLKSEVDQLKGFPTRAIEGSPEGSWSKYNAFGLEFTKKDGHWYLELDENDPAPVVPAIVTESNLVDVISLKQVIATHPHREAGIYRWKTAEAEVESSDGIKSLRMFVNCKATELPDLLELFQKIKAGSIRPEESHESPQSGKSAWEITSELARVTEELAALKAELANSEEQLQYSRRVVTELNVFRTDLLDHIFPLCSRKSVYRAIELILYPTSTGEK